MVLATETGPDAGSIGTGARHPGCSVNGAPRARPTLVNPRGKGERGEGPGFTALLSKGKGGRENKPLGLGESREELIRQEKEKE